ncbi:MAG: ISKra4 family transposase [bacterium]|nr:ISKra4 family transposase [bacterium]
MAASLAVQRLNADMSDQEAPTLDCPCGQAARFAGRRAKSFQTVLGEMRLERAYYHCSQCGQGFFPRDRSFGLEGRSLSPAVVRMTGVVGALGSFEEGSLLLAELAGLSIETKQVERTAEALGEEIAAQERQNIEPDLPVEAAPTLYLGVDGTGIRMRPSELVDRRGKQPDGTAKTREVKLCTVWSAERRDPKGRPTRDPGSVTYTAAIESAATRDTEADVSDFAQRVEREARRRRFYEAPRQVVLGDGAPWIWNLANELFPQAIQIVDRFHAKEHLSTVSKEIYGPGSDLAAEWARQRYEQLDAGQLDDLIQALRRHELSYDEARKCIGYLETNRQRMRYLEFHQQGLCTSTGVVEAGCKNAIGTRLKRSGMRWTVRVFSEEPTPSSPCAVYSSAATDSRISGNAGRLDDGGITF